MSDHAVSHAQAQLVATLVRGWAEPWGVGVGASVVDPADGGPLERGRAAGARALAIAGAAIGHPLVEPVRRNPGSGRPEWSDAVVGAVSHDTELAVAVLGRRSHVLGLGVDVELVGGLHAHEAREVLLCGGEQWCELDDRDPTIRFAAKEAAFKALAGMLGATPPFDLTKIAVTLDATGFSASPAAGGRVAGRWAVVGARIVTFAAVAEGS